MINYSLSIRNANPNDANSVEKKVYATAQYTSVMTLKQLAKHISSHNSKYNRADVEGVLLSLVDCIYELLLDGKRIQLGDMGTFYCSIHSKGADTVDEFTEANITGLTVNWRRSASFESIYNDADFQFAGRRQAQKQLLVDDKQSLRDELASYMGGSTDNSGSASDSGNSGDSGGTSGGAGSEAN